MPPSPKPWVDFGATSTPINSAALVGLELRTANYAGVTGLGTGVDGFESFRVKQQGGGTMQVNVGLAGTQMAAVLPGDSNGGTQRYDYSGGQLVGQISVNASGNPRIDLVTLAPPSTVDSGTPQVIVIAGAPTSGATLTSPAGQPVTPAGRIPLAWVLVPSGASSILTSQIADLRGQPFPGVVPALFTAADLLTPESVGGLQQITTGIVQGTNDNRTAAMLVWLPRRILAARVRWHYRQGAIAAATNYRWSLSNAAGRQLAITSTIAFSGAATTGHSQNDPFTGPVLLEAGAYWLAFESASLGAGASVAYLGYQGVQNGAAIPGVAGPNLYAYGSPTGLIGSGASLSTQLTDAFQITVDTAALSVPACLIGA